jgi:DNA polymerase I
MKKFLVIDAFGLIFKSYYAFINRPLTNKNGKNTSAVFGFFKSLISILKKENPEYILVALDSEGKCFRNDIYPQYKANRPPAPDDLKYQIPVIIRLLDKLGIPYLNKDGFEADDVIGTICAKFANEAGKEAIVLSSDKDLMQLINDKVFMYKPDKSSSEFVRLTGDAVLAEYGITPDQVADYLALTGDASDNIPGVKGIGPKSASALLKEYGTLEKIYENLDNITGKTKDKLGNEREIAFLSKRLATIEKNIPMEFDINTYEKKPLNINSALHDLQNENLNSVIKDIDDYNLNIFGKKKSIPDDTDMKQPEEKKADMPKIIPHEYRLVKNTGELKKISEEIRKAGAVSFDIESTGFDFLNDKLICMSLATKKFSVVVPFFISMFQQKEADIDINEKYLTDIKEILSGLFSDESVTKIGSNLKFDIKFLKNFGIDTKGDLFDTMIAEYCLDAASNLLGLKDLSEKYLYHKMTRYEDVVEDTKKNTLQDVPLDALVNYSGQDADITYRLYELLREKLRENKKIEELFYFIEMPLVKVLIDMEYSGVQIDKNYLVEFSSHLEKEISAVTQKMNSMIKKEFNPNSPKQIADILFNELKLTVVKKTKTGPSTDVDVLTKLAREHPFAGLLLEHRTLTKIKSTYSDALPQMMNNRTGRIHTTYMQTGTQTGRLSSKDPNLQNIPVKTEIGRKIRTAFVPSKGNILISADYAQIELFLLAEFSKDENLFSAFKNNEDIHYKTATLLFGKPQNEITKEERKIGKTVNFGVLYGQSPFALAEDLNITRREAAEFINRYFQNYSGIARYIEELKQKCRDLGYAQTFWGRKRSIPEIYDRNKMRQGYGERMAVNTAIQGTAADLIKIAMIRIHKKISGLGLKSKLILQVHDELIFDVVREEKDSVIPLIMDCMENGYDFQLKLKTSVEIGENWGELH